MDKKCSVCGEELVKHKQVGGICFKCYYGVYLDDEYYEKNIKEKLEEKE